MELEARAGSGNLGGDWLSALPDGLLHAIMSFLKSRQVVQTCVLARRWRHLWCSVPSLDIDQDEYRAATKAAGDDLEGRHFANFVDNLLLFHDAQLLDSFKLRAGDTGRYDNRDADRWCGPKYCPSVLEIHLRTIGFARVWLQNLGSCPHHLKRLHLSGLGLSTSVAQQLQACSVLQELELERSYCLFQEIISHTLKILTIDARNISSTVDHLTITTPALVSLHLRFRGPIYQAGISLKEAHNLVEAYIHVPGNRNACKLLDGLSSVRILELRYFQTMVSIDEGSEKFPTFSNLRTLHLDNCDMSDDFQMLRYFLQDAPNLEKLILQYCKLPDGSKKRKTGDRPKRRISLRGQDLTFQCPNLKRTEIKYSECDEQQLFDLLFGILSKLRETTLVLTKY